MQERVGVKVASVVLVCTRAVPRSVPREDAMAVAPRPSMTDSTSRSGRSCGWAELTTEILHSELTITNYWTESMIVVIQFTIRDSVPDELQFLSVICNDSNHECSGMQSNLRESYCSLNHIAIVLNTKVNRNAVRPISQKLEIYKNCVSPSPEGLTRCEVPRHKRQQRSPARAERVPHIA